EARRLCAANSAAVYAAPGFLLFVRQETLVAQRFDPDRLVLSGEPVTIAARQATRLAKIAASAAANGVIAFRAGSTGPLRRLTWPDRQGGKLGTLGEPDGTLDVPSLSPDGQHVAALRAVNGQRDIWIYETTRDVIRRITAEPTRKVGAYWSPDSRRLIF